MKVSISKYPTLLNHFSNIDGSIDRLLKLISSDNYNAAKLEVSK